MWRLQEEEQVEHLLPRSWEHFHHQRRCAFRSFWAWKKGVWVQVADMLQEWDRTCGHLPIQTGLMEVEPPCWKISWGGLNCPKEADGAASGLHHDSLLSTILLLHSWAHPEADMQVLQTEMQALQDFGWGTAISPCKCGAQHAKQMKVVSCCGTCSSPWFTAFVQLIWPWGCSVQPMLCTHLPSVQRSSYCTHRDKSTNLSVCGCQVRIEPALLCWTKSAVNKQLKTQYSHTALMGY